MGAAISMDNRECAAGFTDEELEALRAAYAGGAQGSVIVGLRGCERLISFGLPPVVSLNAAEKQLREQAKRLRFYGCNGWLYARTVILEREGAPDTMALLVDENCLAYGVRGHVQTILCIHGPEAYCRRKDQN